MSARPRRVVEPGQGPHVRVSERALCATTKIANASQSVLETPIAADIGPAIESPIGIATNEPSAS